MDATLPAPPLPMPDPESADIFCIVVPDNMAAILRRAVLVPLSEWEFAQSRATETGGDAMLHLVMEIGEQLKAVEALRQCGASLLPVVAPVTESLPIDQQLMRGNVRWMTWLRFMYAAAEAESPKGYWQEGPGVDGPPAGKA